MVPRGNRSARVAVAVLTLLSAYASLPQRSFAAFASKRRFLTENACSPVEWKPSSLPGSCNVFDSVCVDQGSRLVFHDERYQIENVQRENTPVLPSTLWNLPMRVQSLPDALAGWQPDFRILVRPVSKAEPTLPLRHPSFSNCTLPVVLLVDYPYNYKTFVVKALTDLDSIFRTKGLTPNHDATLVLATPAGLALEPFHSLLLAPHSSRPVVTLAELGRRGMEGLPAAWAGEGVRVHCYSKLVVCKLDRREGTPPDVAAAAVMASRVGGMIPSDPLGYAAAAPPAGVGEPPVVLRVLVEARSAQWRTLRNVPDILRACEEANSRGFQAGPFNRIVCKALPVAYDAAPPEPDGSIAPDSPATAAFRTALGAVRSAHLFVAMPGSSGAHAFFMSPEGPPGSSPVGAAAGQAAGGPAQGGSGFVELRPCGWGTDHGSLADGSQDSLAQQLASGGDAVRFFALNVEDPGQCSPPDFRQQLQEALATGAMKPEATAHVLQGKSPPRYQPEELLVRDQHVTLRPATLLAMIRHAATLLGDRAAYQAARRDQKLHGYAVPEGLLLGPLGLTDAQQRARTRPPELIAA